MNYMKFRDVVRERVRFATDDDAAKAIRIVLEVLGVLVFGITFSNLSFDDIILVFRIRRS